MIHYEYGSVLERRHLYFGISAIVLSTIVGTAVFSTWESAAIDGWLRVLLGLFSMISAAVAALQTFLNLLDRAAKHKAAGANYGAIRRELELLKTIPPETEDKIKEALEAIKSRMDELTASVPGIPSRFKQRIDDKLRSRAYDRIYQLEPNSAPSDDSDLQY